MIPVLARREADRLARIDTARRWADALQTERGAALGLVAAVVVGSVARGDFNLWSDLDVLVVATELPEGGRGRLSLLMEGAPPGLQPIGWTPDELAARIARSDPLAVEAVGVGVVVFGVLPVPSTPSPSPRLPGP